MKQQLTTNVKEAINVMLEVFGSSSCNLTAVEFADASGFNSDERQYFFAMNLCETYIGLSVSDFDDIELTGTENEAWAESFVAEKLAANEEIAQTNRDIREDEAFYRNREL